MWSPWLWAVLAALVLIPALRPLLRFDPPPPPVLLELPSWQLTDQDGRPFGSDELAGEVYVASFFFTRCRSICPMITAAMKSLEQRYRSEGVLGVRLVSFTVDPEFDAPAVLSDYAREHAIDLERWTLLTGTTEEVRAVVTGAFKTAIGEPETVSGALIDIAHAGQLMLVDQDGFVRGLYGIDPAGRDEIFHRSQHVLRAVR